MRRFRSAIPVLLLLVAGLAHADSIPIFNITSVTIEFDPGEPGSSTGGANFSFSGPGIFITGGGPFDCSIWCGAFNYESAGFPVDIGGIFTTNFFAQIGGRTYAELQGAFSSPWSITFGDLTVPGGEVPAVLNNGLILGHVGSGNNVFQFYLKIPPGDLQVQFFSGDDPSLYTFLGGGEFTASSTVPEPGTMALVATGLAGIVGVLQRKRRSGRAVIS